MRTKSPTHKGIEKTQEKHRFFHVFEGSTIFAEPKANGVLDLDTILPVFQSFLDLRSKIIRIFDPLGGLGHPKSTSLARGPMVPEPSGPPLGRHWGLMFAHFSLSSSPVASLSIILSLS